MRSGVPLLLLGVASAAAFDCAKISFSVSDYDITALAGPHSFQVDTQTPPSVTKTAYTLSLCGPLPSTTLCPPNTAVCMVVSTSATGLEDRVISIVPIAGELGHAKPLDEKVVLGNGTKGAEGWAIELGGGEYNGVAQRAIVQMKCDKSAGETVPTLTSYDPPTGLLSLDWVTKSACPVSGTGSPPPPSPDPKDPAKTPEDTTDPPSDTSSKWGIVSIFFLLLLVSFVLYFALGIYSNYTNYGSSGMDLIPHRDFWRDLPGLVGELIGLGRGRAGRSGYVSFG